MHFEILVEDQSGRKMLEILVRAIIDVPPHTFKIHPYKGIGDIPKGITGKKEANKRILLDRLPQLLCGYGKSFPKNYPAAVILVCDLDDKCLKDFRKELFNILNSFTPKPETRFCFAVEESEAWFLGDIAAIRKAYPKAKTADLQKYENDAICGTWELLADVIYQGGAKALSKKGWQAIGAEKSQWAEKITPYMEVANNLSPSFVYFRKQLLKLAGVEDQ